LPFVDAASEICLEIELLNLSTRILHALLPEFIVFFSSSAELVCIEAYMRAAFLVFSGAGN
jgi:hypothetical protein